MKTITRIIITILILVNVSFAQNPTYVLRVSGFERVANDELQFNIYLLRTGNVGLEYATGQYFFEFNDKIANGGALTYSIVNSDLPVGMQPRNPTVAGTELRLAPNVVPGAGNGVMISNVFPGTKIARMKLKTNAAGGLSKVPLKLKWKNPGMAGFVTKINAYVGAVNTDITTAANHSIWVISVKIEAVIQGLFRAGNFMVKNAKLILQLRKAVFPFLPIDYSEEEIDANSLSGICDFPGVPSGEYYLVVKNSQCIETWSKIGGESLSEDSTTYDYNFTTSSSQAYGNNLIQMGSIWAIYSGDVNQDGVIDGNDLVQIENDAYNFVMGEVLTDLNGDEIVDASDLVIDDNNGFNFITTITP